MAGRSIHDDILHVRLNEAHRLVSTTDLPLKQVAPRSGFRSVAYMTTLFEQGKTTGQVRFANLFTRGTTVTGMRGADIPACASLIVKGGWPPSHAGCLSPGAPGG